MQNKLMFLTLVVLAGCATVDEPVIDTVIQTVQVPIAMPCAVAIPTKPKLNFDALVVEQDIFDKTKAVLADRKLAQAYETELLAALKSCVR